MNIIYPLRLSSITLHVASPLLRTSMLLALFAMVAGCGGGGGNPGFNSAPSARSNSSAQTPTPAPAPASAPVVSSNDLQPSTSLAQKCTANGTGTLDTEKSWVRSFMNETYLWYKDVPQVNPEPFTAVRYSGSNYAALDAYFGALKTPLNTTSGKKVDEFSFTIPTADLDDLRSGVSSGYGIRFTFIKSAPPRLLRVLYVEPNSPADLAGVLRGDTVRFVDDVSIDDNTTAGISTINAGINPKVSSKITVLGLQAPDTPPDTLRFANVVSSQNITVTPVPTITTLVQGTNTVGYLVLNSFSIDSAEKQMIDAVTQLKAANVNELVLDLRYNGGGYLAISNALAYMIGDTSLTGKIYEKISCNDKNPFSICNTSQNLSTSSQGFAPQAAGVPLPQLGLKRVFVLTSASTCSASESLINGLTPFIQVVQVGSGTCGKPYGFYYTDNCGTSYAAMQFTGQNSAGFGDYANGFLPTCQVADDLSKQRGDTRELMLSAALTYMGTGICPAPTTGLQKFIGASADTGNYRVMRSPVEEQRLLGSPVAR